MIERAFDKGAQSREAHARYNFEEIYPPRMINAIPRSGVVMDIGTGVGRDAVAMHDRAEGKLLVIGIEPDKSAYQKACDTYPHKDIVLCRDWDAVAGVKRNRQIAYLIGEVQKLPEPPPQLKAHFINCSAVLMFPPPEEHQAFMNGLHSLAKPRREVFMRFRTEGLREGLTKIDLPTFFDQARTANFFVNRMPDFPDPPPSSRDFKWHDYMLTTVTKG